MIRLRLTLPPLTPREALTLSYLCDLLDTVLWTQYGEAMTTLLRKEPLVPDPWWSIDPDPWRAAKPAGYLRVDLRPAISYQTAQKSSAEMSKSVGANSQARQTGTHSKPGRTPFGK